MHARLDLKVHLGDEFVSIRAVDWDVLENDVFREHNLCTLRRLHLHHGVALGLLRCLFNGSWGLLGDHDSLVSAVGEVFEHLVHLIDECCVASQILYFFVGYDETADSLGQVDEE